MKYHATGNRLYLRHDARGATVGGRGASEDAEMCVEQRGS